MKRLHANPARPRSVHYLARARLGRWLLRVQYRPYEACYLKDNTGLISLLGIIQRQAQCRRADAALYTYYDRNRRRREMKRLAFRDVSNYAVLITLLSRVYLDFSTAFWDSHSTNLQVHGFQSLISWRTHPSLRLFCSIRDLDDNLADMLLGLQIRISIDGLLEREHLVHDRLCSFGVGFDQANHILESEITR